MNKGNNKKLLCFTTEEPNLINNIITYKMGLSIYIVYKCIFKVQGIFLRIFPEKSLAFFRCSKILIQKVRHFYSLRLRKSVNKENLKSIPFSQTFFSIYLSRIMKMSKTQSCRESNPDFIFRRDIFYPLNYKTFWLFFLLRGTKPH